jgi:hypothetical protein
MSEKDTWDKFEIASKIFGSIVLVAIPIVIKFSADSVSSSLQRGQLIQSLTTQLVEGQAKRDIALIALDSAIPEKEKCTLFWFWGCENDLEPKNLEEDQVLGIAEVLVDRSIEDVKKKVRSLDPAEIKIAKKIIILRTNEDYYRNKYGEIFDAIATNKKPTSDQNLKSTPQEKVSKAQISETLSAIQPPVQPNIANSTNVSDLSGIRLLYLQYQSNEKQAKKLQQDLSDAGISVPGIEKIKEIKENDIRYSNAADEQLASKLKDFLERKEGIKINKLIDLSKAGYRVPSGQVEIWLKDEQ